MAGGQVYHMDVVTDSGTIRRRVIIAKDTEAFALADCHLRDVRHQVVGNAARVFADASGRVRPDRIEVAQQDHVPLRICLPDIAENLLQHALGLAVRIGAVTLRASLRDGNLSRVAIDRCGRREDDILAVVASHNVHQNQRPANVVFVVFPGLFNGLAHGLETGKMDAGIEGAGCLENALQGCPVADIDLVEGNLRSRNLAGAAQRLAAGVAEVVYYHRLVSGSNQFYDGVRAYETGAARYKDSHAKMVLLRKVTYICRYVTRKNRFRSYL